MGSQPDWSSPPNIADALKPLRDAWIPLILHQNLHKEFLVHIAQQRPDPPFSDDCINQFRNLFSSWLPVDWSVRSEQPMCLAALNALGQKLQDPDRLLFDCLISGVSAGTSDDPIHPSGVFWPKDTTPDVESPSLQLHRGNWKSSEDYPELTAELK